jgi:hypothetical protein
VEEEVVMVEREKVVMVVGVVERSGYSLLEGREKMREDKYEFLWNFVKK